MTPLISESTGPTMRGNGVTTPWAMRSDSLMTAVCEWSVVGIDRYIGRISRGRAVFLMFHSALGRLYLAKPISVQR